MPQTDRLLGTYLHLARASVIRNRPMMRDKLLVLAGVLAEEMGVERIGDICRHEILLHNPRHLVRRWASLAAALLDERFQTYLKQVRRRFSPEKAEYMLETLGIDMAHERELYYTEVEYAASLLGMRPDSIDAFLAQNPVAVGMAREAAARRLAPGLDMPSEHSALIDPLLPIDMNATGMKNAWKLFLVAGVLLSAVWLLTKYVG